jgi:hypothetical protein
MGEVSGPIDFTTSPMRGAAFPLEAPQIQPTQPEPIQERETLVTSDRTKDTDVAGVDVIDMPRIGLVIAARSTKCYRRWSPIFIIGV